jgi:L-asparaginase
MKKKTDSDVHIVFTGGTIDSLAPQTLPYRSFVPSYLKSLYFPQTKYTHLFSKYSDDITPLDKKLMSLFLECLPEQYIILLHGTDTMAETASYLKQHLKRTDQTIFLVGSMDPLGKVFSDAPFNLGFALARIYDVPSGVYIAMHGRLFEPFHVRKNFELRRFEEV